MDWRRMGRLAIFHGLVGGALLAGRPLAAGPLDSWGGGSATASAPGQQSTGQGAQAEAFASGSTPLYYSSPYNSDPRALHVEARGTARAEVLGESDALLRVNARYAVDNPGTRPMGFHSDVSPLTSAQASWTGDRIHVGAGADGSVPDSIRVGVTLTLTNAWAIGPDGLPRGGTLDLQVGDRHIELSDNLAMTDTSSLHPDLSTWLVNRGFDAAERETDPSAPGVYHAKAYLDLAVGANGWTSPFDLSLKSSLAGVPQSNSPLRMQTGDFTLSLDDITLPDGTPAIDAGHAITFESGLEWPAPVPEPASVACWVGLAAAAVAGRCRRRRA